MSLSRVGWWVMTVIIKFIMLSSKKIVSDSIMMSSQMMLYSACMAYLKDKLIGSKPKKDSAALCNCVAIFTNKTQNIIKHEGLYMTKTNCISVMNLLWDRAKIKSCH